MSRIAPIPSTSIVDVLRARGISPATEDEHRTEVLYNCPLPDHDDRNPSFSVSTEKNLWKCFGCDRGGDVVDLVALLDQVDRETAIRSLTADAPVSVTLENAPTFDLGPLVEVHGPEQTVEKPGLKLEELATAKGLPLEHLRACGWTTIPEYMGAPAVRIPYHDENGEEQSVRFRVALSGGNRFRWKKHNKPMLYGLDRLAEARQAGYVIMVEGETDTVTLRYQGFPVVGAPGAGTWKDPWANPLEKIKTVYLVIEPDRGGEKLLQAVSGSRLRERLRIIRMAPETKDMNALYLADPALFQARVQALMKDAVRLSDLDRERDAQEVVQAEAFCAHLLSQTDILSLFAETVRTLGVAGEERAVKLLYLILTSRLLDKPVPAIMKGPSASGKSYLVEQVLRFFPESAYYTLSATSEHALIRTKESFVHRFLIIYEAEGVMGDFLQYLLRSLISEGCIKYLTLVESGSNGWEPTMFEKEGPTGVILTTTRVSLHPENETRMFSIPTDDTPEQTTRIFAAIAEQEERDSGGDDELLAPWVALQTVLEAGPRKVYIPYLQALAEGVDPSATRLRRDYTNLLTLIRANALLHWRSRELDAQGRIVATDEDYKQVYNLVRDLMEEGAQASVPKRVRETVIAARALLSDRDTHELSVATLARKLELDPSTVRRRVREAMQRGFLINKATDGKSYRIVAGDDMPADRPVLPPVEHVHYWINPPDEE